MALFPTPAQAAEFKVFADVLNFCSFEGTHDDRQTLYGALCKVGGGPTNAVSKLAFLKEAQWSRALEKCKVATHDASPPTAFRELDLAEEGTAEYMGAVVRHLGSPPPAPARGSPRSAAAGGGIQPAGQAPDEHIQSADQSIGCADAATCRGGAAGLADGGESAAAVAASLARRKGENGEASMERCAVKLRR